MSDKPMMKCGHAANAVKTGTDIPVCVVCYGIVPGADVVDDSPPDLSGRFAECAYNPSRHGCLVRLDWRSFRISQTGRSTAISAAAWVGIDLGGDPASRFRIRWSGAVPRGRTRPSRARVPDIPCQRFTKTLASCHSCLVRKRAGKRGRRPRSGKAEVAPGSP